jgi:hypothetical protein
VPAAASKAAGAASGGEKLLLHMSATTLMSLSCGSNMFMCMVDFSYSSSLRVACSTRGSCITNE